MSTALIQLSAVRKDGPKDPTTRFDVIGKVLPKVGYFLAFLTKNDHLLASTVKGKNVHLLSKMLKTDQIFTEIISAKTSKYLVFCYN